MEVPALTAALLVLQRGGVVAAATESSFGLLASAYSKTALDQLFAIKPRDPTRGVGVLVPNVEAFEQLADVEPALLVLARAFWPGRLTLVAPAAQQLDTRLLVAGRVAARVPGPSPAADLVHAFGGPLTATSANLTGEPPCVQATDVAEVFASQLADGGLHLLPLDAPGGAPSTFVAWADGQLSVLRNGALDEAELRAALVSSLDDRTPRVLP